MLIITNIITNNMVEFKCIRCGYSTSKKSCMVAHFNKKLMCSANLRDVNIDDYRTRILQEDSPETLYEKIDELKDEVGDLKDNNKELEDTKVSLEDRIKLLESENQSLKTQLTNININSHNNINITNNTTINVSLTKWNDPDLCSDDFYIRAIKQVCNSVPTMVKHIHFNEELPQNHNILFTNLRSDTGSVFNGTDWVTLDKKEIIDELIAVCEARMEGFAEHNPVYSKYIEQYKEIKENRGEEVDQTIRKLLNILLYDKQHIVKDTKSVIKKQKKPIT